MAKPKSIISGQPIHKKLQAILILSNGKRHALSYSGGKYAPGVLLDPGYYELDGSKLLSFSAHMLTIQLKVLYRTLGVNYQNACVWTV